MALHLEVRKDVTNPDILHVHGEWEDGRRWLPTRIVREPNMTAAEMVEWALLLNYQLVASWRWDSRREGPFLSPTTVLLGQFVYGRPDGQLAHKEVSDSNAHLYDL